MPKYHVNITFRKAIPITKPQRNVKTSPGVMSLKKICMSENGCCATNLTTDASM